MRLQVYLCLLFLFANALRVAAYDERKFTCLAPFLKAVDTAAPNSMDEAFLQGPWSVPERVLPDSAKPEFGTFTNQLASAWFAEGMVLVHLFDPQSAETCFRRALQLEPDSAIAYWGLCLANSHRLGRATFFLGEAQRRVSNRKGLSRFERVLIRTWSVEDPLPPVEALVLDDPEQAGLSALHLYLVLLGDLDRTRPIANRFANDLQANALPANHPGRASRLLLWRNQSSERALETAKELTEAMPERHQVWQLAADVSAVAGQFDAAIEQAMQAHALQGKLDPLIDLFIDSGRFAEATNLCHQLIAQPAALEPGGTASPHTGIRLLGRACLESGRDNDLVLALRRPAVTLLPVGSLATMEASRLEGLALHGLGRTKEAASILQRMKDGLQVSGADNDEVKAPARDLRDVLEGKPSARRSAPPQAGSFRAIATACDEAWQAGSERDAMRLFTQDFRDMARRADPDLPVLARLDSVAEAMRLPAWRSPRPPTRVRVVLSFPKAPAVRLHDKDGSEFVFAKPERPTVLNFFVGVACPVCLIQLTKFAPHVPSLNSAGIDFLSVTPELPEDIAGGRVALSHSFRHR